MKLLELYKHICDRSADRFVNEVFEDRIYKSANPQLNLIDLGAYKGEWSFSCLPFAKHIWAIEPDPQPYNDMAHCVKEFDLGEVMSIYPIGIYNRSGRGNLNALGDGGSAITEKPGDKNVEIDMLTLNEFMVRENIENVDILKIDVESSEDSIFSASDFHEAAAKIKYIIGERHSGEGFMALLARVGFKVTLIDNNLFTATK